MLRAILLSICLNLSVEYSACADDRSQHHLFQKVASVFSNRCSSCHYGLEAKGALDLFHQESFQRGGDSGPLIDSSDWESSLLWQQVSNDSMPPEKPLSHEERTIVRDWLEAGARWTGPMIDPYQYTSDSRAGRDWWSLQPLAEWDVPFSSNVDRFNGIDGWIEETHRRQNLKASPVADKRSLLRRVYMDIIGLPPTMEAMNVFLQDQSPDAYERVVDELLASPQYGERWARHWLDVARFGESNGFEYDEPRDHFWHYRNWVIQSLNHDLHYDEFVRLQLAGDVLSPDDFSSRAATGFLVAGPHNTTLPANDKMRMAMAQDELEDLVGTVSQTFLGLTANCARCHDHKFDPIRQSNYYEFAATLAGVSHGERSISITFTKEEEASLQELRSVAHQAEQERFELESSVRNRILIDRRSSSHKTEEPPRPIALWDFCDSVVDKRGLDTLSIQLHGGAVKNSDGIQFDGKTAFASSSILTKDLRAKTLEVWVKLTGLDQRGGAPLGIQSLDGSHFDAIVFGEKEASQWMAGSNGFSRTQSFHGPPESEAQLRYVHFAIAYREDGTIEAYRDGVAFGQPYQANGLQVFEAGKSQVLFGLRHAPVGGDRMLSGNVRMARVYDRALNAEEVLLSYQESERDYVSPSQLAEAMSLDQRSHVEALVQKADFAQQRVQSILQSHQIRLYACVSTQPTPTYVLRRGDVGSPGDMVSPRGLDAIPIPEAGWTLPSGSSDADRRVRLANWIAHPSNPLFVRVIANRLWHYHFGQGIVDTPNDFGFQGSRPTHPELLDYLANRFKDGGMQWKPLHREIVLSRTYRQSSSMDAGALLQDAGNRFLWRKAPIRLEAEEVRDSMLAVAGLLDHSMGGIGYRDVRHEFFRGSHFYHRIEEAKLALFRRTVYRFSPRGGRNPFLETFDCPDPSTVTPKRANTTTPLQALAMLNNSLVLEVADRLAQRAKAQAVSDSFLEREWIEIIYREVFQRLPSVEEATMAQAFVKEHGLAAFCRVVLNSNEFLYVR